VGFWCSLFVLTWGISGICLCFPGILISLLGREFRYWVIRLHFGRFNGSTEAFWTILGLAPAALAATGALMWWNRVLRKKIRHRSTLIGGVTGGQPKV
jgi:PepSY-associated TM region